MTIQFGQRQSKISVGEHLTSIAISAIDQTYYWMASDDKPAGRNKNDCDRDISRRPGRIQYSCTTHTDPAISIDWHCEAWKGRPRSRTYRHSSRVVNASTLTAALG